MSYMHRIFLLVIVASSSAVRADIFTGTGFNLVDRVGNTTGDASGNIVVAGNGGTIASFNSVSIFGLTHTWVGDLSVDLTNTTTGQIVVLTSPPDNAGANFSGNYTFLVNAAVSTIDQAVATLVDADNIAPGNYAISDYGNSAALGTIGPRTNFDAFTGLAVDGTWRLRFLDFGPGDTGGLTSWNMNISVTAVPEPTSFALAALVVSPIMWTASRRRRKLRIRG